RVLVDSANSPAFLTWTPALFPFGAHAAALCTLRALRRALTGLEGCAPSPNAVRSSEALARRCERREAISSRYGLNGHAVAALASMRQSRRNACWSGDGNRPRPRHLRLRRRARRQR